MTGYTVHTGSNDNFSSGWDRVFGDGGGQKAKSGKKAAGSTKAAASKRKAGTKSAKSKKSRKKA